MCTLYVVLFVFRTILKRRIYGYAFGWEVWYEIHTTEGVHKRVRRLFE